MAVLLWDPYVFGPPESVIILSGSGSFHQKAKKVRKTLISTILWLFLTFDSPRSYASSSSRASRGRFEAVRTGTRYWISRIRIRLFSSVTQGANKKVPVPVSCFPLGFFCLLRVLVFKDNKLLKVTKLEKLRVFSPPSYASSSSRARVSKAQIGCQCCGSVTFWCGIRIRGSMPLTNVSGFGSESGSAYYCHGPSRGQQKTIHLVFLLITFWRYTYIIF